MQVTYSSCATNVTHRHKRLIFKLEPLVGWSSFLLFLEGVGWSSSLLSLLVPTLFVTPEELLLLPAEACVVFGVSGGLATILSTSARPTKSSGRSHTDVRDDGL
jgi:hypothetical protein